LGRREWGKNSLSPALSEGRGGKKQPLPNPLRKERENN